MKQKGRKNSLIVSVLLPVELIKEMDEAIASQNANTLKAPLCRSEWLRRAIERDIAHTKRSRRKRGSVEVTPRSCPDPEPNCPVALIPDDSLVAA